LVEFVCFVLILLSNPRHNCAMADKDTRETGRPRKRPSLSGRLSSAATALKRSFSPIPKVPHPPPGNTAEETTGPLEDLKKLGFEDLDTLLGFLNAHVHGVTDDSELLLERVIQLLAKLPHTSEEGAKLQDGFIHSLWEGLPHPPVTTLGEEHRYRTADGSNNNIHMPSLGAAGQPYARTTPPMTYQNPNLPDPELVFDTLMARDKFEPHPNRISSVLFYTATIIIHDIFQTDHPNYNINRTSSYLDLAPLYGRNLDEQLAVRTMKDGLLKPDCFSSKRIMGFPPGVGVFLIMFNRFHNYVVTQLAHINEKGRFNKPADTLSADAAKAAWTKYDEDLFQHGRLITSAMYVNIVLRDYVRTILNVNRSPTTFGLDPRTKDGKNILSKPTPVAGGSQVSAEFNLIYRWHSTLSERDVKWTEDEFKRLLGDKIDPETADLKTVLGALHGFEGNLSDDPLARPFAGLKRKENGTLPDDELVKIWCESVDDVACGFGANRVPKVLRAVDILGIIQARFWNLATLNEFREHFGLTRYKKFTDINPDEKVAKQLQALYDSVDSVELYPGLVAEKAKPPMSPGSGLCVNYTISRAILSDAVSLVRGDRFYTVDFTPQSLTNWGFHEVSWDRTVDNGHVFYKLISRAFPNHFQRGSIYAHYPLVIPSENKKILEKLEMAHMYTWDKPHTKGDLIMIRSHAAAVKVLGDPKNFKVTWGDAINFLTDRGDGKPHGANFCLAGDGEANAKNRDVVRKALYDPKGWEKEVAAFYARTVPALLKKYSHELGAPKGGKVTEVDIVRDVINLANTRFCAQLFCLPIKIEENPKGLFTEQELYLMLTAIFSSIFFDSDPAASLKVREMAHDFAGKLGEFVTMVASSVKVAGGVVEALANFKEKDGYPALSSFGNEFIGRMLEKGKSVEECVWGTIMPLISANVPNQSQVMAQCIDYYLGDGAEHLPELYRLARENTPAADEKLMHYMLEGCRLRGTPAVYRDVEADGVVLEDYATAKPNPKDHASPNAVPIADPAAAKIQIPVGRGRRVLVNLVTAGRDATVFPEPDKVRLDRPVDSYIHFGWGPHRCAGMETARVAQTALFKAVVGLKGLRRTKGPQGVMKSMPVRRWGGQMVAGQVDENSVVWTGLRVYMTGDQSGYFPVPTTMKVMYDQ
jgi:hypothetical protein